MFGGNYQEMIETVESAIDNYSSPLREEKKGKTKMQIIDKISYETFHVEDRPSLLIRACSYNTHINDGYCETDQRVELGANGKIGSDTNFFLLFPMIEGIDPSTKKCYFVVLVYEDPTKDSGSVQKIAKHIMTRVVHQPIKNVKPDVLLQELKKVREIPELKIILTGVSFDDDGDAVFNNYLVHSKLKQAKESTYQNFPTQHIGDLFDQTETEGVFTKRLIQCNIGRNTFKFLSEKKVKDAKEEWEEVAEKIFNMSTYITEKEFQTDIHTPSFVVEKLTGILSNYLASYDDSQTD